MRGIPQLSSAWIRAALADAWPCRVCAMARSTHTAATRPAWVHPHAYERYGRPARATVTITSVDDDR